MSKKDYADYPEQYFNLLEQFSNKMEDIELTGTYSEMVYLRHDLNRFFKLLSAAGRRGDKYAQNLNEITRDMVLSLSPSRAKKDSPAILTVKVNPIVKAVLKFSPKE